MSSANNTGVVILAAGASTRLGKAKQLLKYKGKSLLQHAIDAAINSTAHPVVVVLGANADRVLKDIDKSKTNVVVNTEWEEGMASSLRNGLNELLFIEPSTDAVIFMVCDQPHVSADVLNALVKSQQETGKLIVTCSYGEAMGPPALFSKSLFHELMQLKGDAGARKVIELHYTDVATISFEKGKIDIDTEADYNALT